MKKNIYTELNRTTHTKSSNGLTLSEFNKVVNSEGTKANSDPMPILSPNQLKLAKKLGMFKPFKRSDYSCSWNELEKMYFRKVKGKK